MNALLLSALSNNPVKYKSNNVWLYELNSLANAELNPSNLADVPSIAVYLKYVDQYFQVTLESVIPALLEPIERFAFL